MPIPCLVMTVRTVEFPNWRGLICEEIGQYIERTERFKETQCQKLAFQ